MIKEIPGYEGLYYAGEDGKIYSHPVRSKADERKGKPVDEIELRELTQTLKKRGYYTVTMYSQKGKRKYMYVHRALALTFIDNPQYLPEINHINGIKTDNRLCNLEWCTRRYNSNHAMRIGIMKCHGEDNPFSKLKNSERKYIAEMYNTRTVTAKDLAKKFKVSLVTIYRIARDWAT